MTQPALTYHIAGLAKFIQPAGMLVLSPQDDVNRQEFLTLTAAIIHAREYRTDVIVWRCNDRWEWAPAADPLPISAHVDGVPECQITVTDGTGTVRRVIQLGESTVTPVPGKKST